MNLKDFAEWIRVQGQRTVTVSGEMVIETAGLIHAGITVSTPVDTGRARGNWVVSVGQPFTGILDTTDKTGRGTIERGRQAARQFQAGASQTVYITNNLPYIERLNNGWSAQAPAGFVEDQIQRALEYIRSRNGRVL